MEVRDLNALIPLKPGQVRGCARTEPTERDMTVGELREALKDFPANLRVGYRIAPTAVQFHPIRAAHLKAIREAVHAHHQTRLIHIVAAREGDEIVLLLMEHDTPVIPEKKRVETTRT